MGFNSINDNWWNIFSRYFREYVRIKDGDVEKDRQRRFFESYFVKRHSYLVRKTKKFFANDEIRDTLHVFVVAFLNRPLSPDI